MKILFLIFTIVFSLNTLVSAQSKKKQIFILKGKLDSLKEENTQTKYLLDISRKLEIRNKQEIDSLESILNIQETKLNANKVGYDRDLKQLQRELDLANISLKNRVRDLDSIARLPENSIALSDSSRLAYFSKYLVSPNQTVSSGVLGDLNLDGYVDLVLILQDTLLQLGGGNKGYIYKSPIVLNIYFWNNKKSIFELHCSNTSLFDLWALPQGESIDMEIIEHSLFLDHLSATYSHQINEKIYLKYNQKSNDFLMDNYY